MAVIKWINTVGNIALEINTTQQNATVGLLIEDLTSKIIMSPQYKMSEKTYFDFQYFLVD